MGAQASFMNMFYEHGVHEPELRELDMSLALECLTGLARRRRKAYNRRAGREKFLHSMHGGCNYATGEASFEAQAWNESRPGVGSAGLTMSLVGGASAAAVPTQDVPRVPNVAPSHEITLGDEESPTSAWRRSMSSTRRTQDRFAAWYRKPVVADAVAAEGAELPEDVAAAEVADAVAAVVAARLLPVVGRLPPVLG